MDLKAVEAKAAEHVLTLDDIIKADDVEYAMVPGFKPGQVFRIRSVTADEMIKWTEANEGEAKRTAGLRLIVKSVCDKDGNLLMTDEHLSILRRKTHRVTNGLIDAILEHNGMTVKGKKLAGETDAKKD